MSDSYYDALWDRICDEEEEELAADEMGMTVAEFRKYCAEVAADLRCD
jgi:hypothetical protein